MQRSLLLILVVLAGCATLDLEALRAWEGRKLGELEQHPYWGVPDEKITLSDGSIAYIYIQQGSSYSHSSYSGFSVLQTYQCKQTFITDGKVIKSYRYKGRCEAEESMLPASPQS